jgi:hypothetical protein
MTYRDGSYVANDAAKRTSVVLIKHHVAMTWSDVKFWMENLTKVPTGFLSIIQVPPMIQNKILPDTK